mmetsp:Transcript_44070/g.95007  ORF Transcript_44070/g.95007 Transcript_44070/m.95007 type:complete len:154 (-) Transcript_44070:46-507(-)
MKNRPLEVPNSDISSGQIGFGYRQALVGVFLRRTCPMMAKGFAFWHFEPLHAARQEAAYGRSTSPGPWPMDHGWRGEKCEGERRESVSVCAGGTLEAGSLTFGRWQISKLWLGIDGWDRTCEGFCRRFKLHLSHACRLSLAVRNLANLMCVYM